MIMPSKIALPASRPHLASMPIVRGAGWFVAVAAFTLIAVSLGSYFYHRRQMDSIAAKHLRLVVAGSGQLQVGMPSVYNLQATTVTGEPWAAQVEWSLSTPDGKRLVDRKEPTDDQGRLTMIVPADMDLSTRSHGLAQLTVTAGGGANPPSVVLSLPIRPARYVTRLWLDRRSYRAGETVYYRSLTVSRYSLIAHRTLPMEFEILDPKLVSLPDSRIDGLTNQGVGNGSFRLSDSLPAGTYTLVARGLDNVFPEERLAFEVIGPATPHFPAKTITEEIPKRTGPAHVDFYPEGGIMAAGIENRVYFAARDAKGQPLEIRGNIVNGKGASVSRVETAYGGLGVFSLVPDAAETYRLKIVGPAGISESPRVPPASSDQKIAIATGQGVFAPGAPLEFNLRAAKDRLPLVITARLRGLLVGQQMVVASSQDQQGKANTVSIPLDDQVAGVIRLTVYDYTKSPPQVLAERLVYRQPRRLVVRAAEGKKPAGELWLSVQNDKGRPVAAALGLTVLDGEKDKTSRPNRSWPDLLHALLIDGDLENPAAIQSVDLNFSAAETAAMAADGTRCVSAALLDLVLGCQGPRAAETSGDTKRFPEEMALSPLVLFDNLNELRAQYEATLSEYRAKRTHVVNALIMLSFFGGLALALLVTMLALLRIVWGSRLWLPTIVATICCVVVTAVSNEPSRMKPVEAATVGFAPYIPRFDTELKEQNSWEPAISESLPADSKLRNLAEKLSKTGGEEEKLKSFRFVVRQYALPDMARSIAGEDGGKPLAWYPLVMAGADGRVTLPGLMPAVGRPLRLFIDAHGDGRIESCVLPMK